MVFLKIALHSMLIGMVLHHYCVLFLGGCSSPPKEYLSLNLVASKYTLIPIEKGAKIYPKWTSHPY